MKNSKASLKKPSTKAPKWLILGFLIASLVGFADATYLTLKYYLGTPLVCTIFEDCEKVLNSQYAMIGQIPVAFLGVIYYLAVFFLTLIYLKTKQENLINFTARLTIVGFLASVWFFYLQAFVIRAFCLYCLLSVATSTSLFILGIFLLKSLNIRQDSILP